MRNYKFTLIAITAIVFLIQYKSVNMQSVENDYSWVGGIESYKQKQINALTTIKNKMNVSNPIVRDRELRYIEDRISSIQSEGNDYREPIGPEIGTE